MPQQRGKMKVLYLLLMVLLGGVAGKGQGSDERTGSGERPRSGERTGSGQQPGSGERWFAADDPRIQYMGRVDFSNPRLLRFWSSGVTIRIRYRGARFRIVVHVQVQDDKTHNYIVML